jgi:hypothetical protein
MKKVIKLGSLLILIAITLTPASSDAYNPLAHIYIAENACPSCCPKIDYYYGSIAPDIALYVANPAKWPTSFNDTHEDEDTIDLSSFASGSSQMAFAMGWLTHGQNIDTPGADYFAHIAYSHNPPSYPTPEGYVIEKAKQLQAAYSADLDLNFAHYVIETTIDLLLKRNNDSALPGKLFFANLFRSWQDRNLLMKVFVWNWADRKTDWLALATAELTFRQLVNRYATALMLQAPNDASALAQLGTQLASEMYGLNIQPDFLLNTILPAAIDLCKEDNGHPDYLDVINEAITAVSANF